jgi:hypothetical protein
MPYTVRLENANIANISFPMNATMNGQMFLTDPVGTLRRIGVSVPVGTEAAWRQVANSFLALRKACDAHAGQPVRPATAPMLSIGWEGP